MATEIDQKKVDKLAEIVKKNPGNSETFYVEKSGIARNQILRYLVLAELKADPSLKIPATGKSIAKARAEGVRWPRIAARAGVSEAKAKELFTAETGTDPRESYTGRGRNFSGTPSAAKPKGTGTSGRRGAAGKPATPAKPKGTSGRRGAAGKPATSKPAGRRSSRAGASAPDPK